jgi:hypothetical protein
MKPKLSPQQKQDKIARDQLTYISNRIRGAWSLKQLSTVGDMLKLYGDTQYIKNHTPNQLNDALTFDYVKEFLSDRRIELEVSLWLRDNPPIIEPNEENQIAQITNQIKAERAEFAEQTNQSIEETSDPYSLPEVPGVTAFLYWFQKKACRQIIDGIEKGHTADLLIAATGVGKTFIAGYIIAWMKWKKFHVGKTYTPWPYVYVTKASVVEQTKRVFRQFFSLTDEDILVINIDQLRATFGERFVREEIKVEYGEESCKWVWRPNIYPIAIFWDECQSLKNLNSQQSSIAQAFNDIDTDKTYQLFISATPFIRVIESKCFVVATRIPYSFGILKNAPMTNSHFNDFAKNIASNYGRFNTDPIENSPAAINRLMDYMDEYVVRVKGIKTQFKARNNVEVIDFVTEKGRNEYMNAWDDFLAEKAKIEGDQSCTAAQSRFNILAQLQVFLKAAESNSDRIKILGDRMHHAVLEGYSAVAAVRFKITIVRLVQYLMDNFGVKRDEISLIWGGAPTATKKQKLKKKITPELLAAFESQGITLEDLDLDDVDENEVQQYPPELRLGNQNAKHRQEEIDRCQKGNSLYCIYTFRAGGVGLSLHHTDEFTKEKVRHKASGYAYEEDIPLIPTRPRRNYVAPTWSAIELVQGVGRCPRLTSLSDTIQTMLFFRGTVEERQARVVGRKLICLTKVVRNRESYEDLIIGRAGMTEDQVEEQLIKEPTQDLYDEDRNGSGTEGTYLDDESEENK